MKKRQVKLILIVFIIFWGGIFSGCQQTPDKEIVTSKNNNNFEEMISVTNIPTEVSNKQTSEPISELTNDDQAYTVTKWNDKLSWSNNKEDVEVIVEIDANIIQPINIYSPVIKVKGMEFTVEQAELARMCFMEDKAIYENNMVKTKYDYLDDLMRFKQVLENIKKRTDLTEEEINTQTIIYESLINKIEGKIDFAPIEIELIPTEIEFKKVNSGISSLDLIRVLTYDDSKKTNLTILNSETDNIYYLEWYITGTQYFGEELPIVGFNTNPIVTSRKELSNKMLDDMNITHMSLSAVSSVDNGSSYLVNTKPSDEDVEKSCTIFHYTRSHECIISNYAYSIEESTSEDALYRPSYEMESIDVYVDSTGIIQFVWQSPMEIVEIENENVKILTLEEIKSIFINQITLSKSWAMPATKKIIHITSVEYGLTRIAVQNNSDEYRYVPSWTFYGYEETIKHMVDGDKTTITSIPYASYLTINAIDGSIIDRSLGY